MPIFHRSRPATSPEAISSPPASQSLSVPSVVSSADSWNDISEAPDMPASVAQPPEPIPRSRKRQTRINATFAKVFHALRSSHPSRTMQRRPDPKIASHTATIVPEKSLGKTGTDLPLNNAEAQSKPINKQCGLLPFRRRLWNRSNKDVSLVDTKDRKVHPVIDQPVAQAPMVTTADILMNNETKAAPRRQTIKQACHTTFQDAEQKRPVFHSHRIALQQLYLTATADPVPSGFTSPKQTRTQTQPKEQSTDLAKSVSDTALIRKYGALQGIIGKGACGTVHLASKFNSKGKCTLLFAIKKYHQPHSFESEKQYVNRLTNEFRVSSTLHHVNVVKTIDLIHDKARGWCEVMEYCPGGDLYALLHDGALLPNEADCYFGQLVNGIAYLHSMGIAHRDIKPEKLLLDASGCIKIADFGNSEVFRTVWEKNMHSAGGLSGNMEYVSPEELLEETFDPRCADVWASGIVYIAMIHARIPWKSATIDDPSYSRYRTNRTRPQTPSLKRTVENRSSIPSPHIHTKRPPCPIRSQSTPVGQTDCGPGYAMIASLPPVPRLLLFQILDPDPKTRNTIEDVLCSPWVLGIETCHPSVVPANYAESVRRAREERAKNETQDAAVEHLNHEGNGRISPVLPNLDRFAVEDIPVQHAPKPKEILKNEMKTCVSQDRNVPEIVGNVKTNSVPLVNRVIHQEPEDYMDSESRQEQSVQDPKFTRAGKGPEEGVGNTNPTVLAA